jgi:predicted extracellular nuclease
MEDPITIIKSKGYVDLIAAHIGPSAYSYVYEGQYGYLDHALASTSLAPQVTNVTIWHINADEPNALDYNMEKKTNAQISSWYNADPYRSSDHDPVIIGLNLSNKTAGKS